MRVLRVRFLCLYLGSLYSAAAAGPLVLRGHLAGELEWGEEFPAVHWAAEVNQGSDGAAEAKVAAQLWGSEVRATLQMPAKGEGSWKIEQAKWSVATLWEQMAEKLPSMMAAMEPSGVINVYGAGAWVENEPRGPLQFTWAEGGVKGAEPEFTVEGLEMAFEFAQWFGAVREGQGALRFARSVVAGAELEEGVVALTWREDGAMLLGPGRMKALGGAIVFSPVEWPGERGGVTVTVQAISVSLARLAALAPRLVRAATGTVSGQVVLRWEADGGISPIDGHLTIDAQQPVDLSLAPQPGFLTRQVPKRYEFLPGWMGPIARKLSPVNPAYEMLEGIELGRLPLRVDRLEVEFYPPEDPLGRTVRIEIDGRPSTGEVVDKVTIRVNLAGPLADIIRLGLDNRAQISGRLK